MKKVIGLMWILLALASCSKSNSSNPVTPPTGGTPIGPSGGTVISSDSSIRIVIPAGALSETQNIAIQTSTNTCPQGFGTAYLLLPDGLTFTKPVTLTMHYADSNLTGSTAKLIGVGYKDNNGAWWGVTGGTVDTIAKTVSVPILHFSDWSEYESYSISPTKATVPTSGNTHLTVTQVGPPADAPESPIVGLNPTPIAANEWDVNGIADGNSSVGTIMALAIATYTAPASMPSPDPVTVQAKIVLADHSVVWLYSSIFVLTKKWELRLQQTFEMYWSDGSGLEVTDTSEDDMIITLDDHGQVASTSPGVVPLEVVHVYTSASGCYTSSGKTGTHIKIDQVTGGYDGISSLELSIDYTYPGAPGYTLHCGPTNPIVFPPDNSEAPGSFFHDFTPLNAPAPLIANWGVPGLLTNSQTLTLIPK